MHNENLRLDGLTLRLYQKLISPDFHVRDAQDNLTTKKISWGRWAVAYIPNRLINFFQRLGFAILNLKWETDRSLLNHLIVHIKKNEKFANSHDYKVVARLFHDLIIKTGEKIYSIESEQLKKLNPEYKTEVPQKPLEISKPLPNEPTKTVPIPKASKVENVQPSNPTGKNNIPSKQKEISKPDSAQLTSQQNPLNNDKKNPSPKLQPQSESQSKPPEQLQPFFQAPQRPVNTGVQQNPQNPQPNVPPTSLNEQIPPPSMTSQLFQACQDTVVQSNDPKHINWKVEKYEALLQQIRDGAKNHLSQSSFTLEELTHKNEDDSQTRKLVKDIFIAIFNVDKDERGIHQKHLSKVREVYNKYIDALRAAADNITKFVEEKDAKYPSLVLKLCEHRFTGPILTKEYRNIVNTINQLGIEELQKKSPKKAEQPHKYKMLANIKQMFKNIAAAPTKAKAPTSSKIVSSVKGHFNIGFDPHRQGNFAHQWLKLTIGKKELDLLAFGTPTIENNPTTAEIIPDFKSFLKSYKQQNKKHLYVSHQKFIPVTFLGSTKLGAAKGGDETNRSKAIHELQSNHEYVNTFYAMTLTKNSPFYDQDHYKETTTRIFTKDLIEEVFDKAPEVSGNNISIEIREAYKKATGLELKVWANNAIAKIHESMFEGKAHLLSPEERKNFIEIFYYFLILEVAQKLDVNSMNTSCKDDIDRGIGESTKLFGFMKVLKDEENTDEAQKDFFMQIFGRALAVRKREIIREKMERCLQVVSYAIEQKAGLKKVHAQLFPETKIQARLA